MNKQSTPPKRPIARKLPEDCPKKTPTKGSKKRGAAARAERNWVLWEGRKIPLVQDNGGLWRLRSRSKHFNIDATLGTPVLSAAKLKARDVLESGQGSAHQPASRGSLEHLCEVYLASPKKTAPKVAQANVSRLRVIVRLMRGKELKDVPVADLNAKLWLAYQAARLTELGFSIDYTRRRKENHSINAAVRAARCVAIKGLRSTYEQNGIRLARDADVVMWLPEPVLVKEAAQDTDIIAAWRQLRETDFALWLVIGLARFAGLRREEILQCRGKWVVERAGVVHIELRDRPEDDYQTKTGKPYLAPVIDPDLAAVLVALPHSTHVVQPPDPNRERWIERTPQAWCRPFVGGVQKPLHRLRSLYAADLSQKTSDAVAATLAGTRAASSALGHTTTAVTEKHYL